MSNIEKPDLMDKNELQIWNPEHQINQKIIKRAQNFLAVDQCYEPHKCYRLSYIDLIGCKRLLKVIRGQNYCLHGCMFLWTYSYDTSKYYTLYYFDLSSQKRSLEEVPNYWKSNQDKIWKKSLGCNCLWKYWYDIP